MSETLTVAPSCLEGTVELSGAKNSVLKLLAASLLTESDVVIENFPSGLSDAVIHVEMLEKLGKRCVVSNCGTQVTISQVDNPSHELVWDGRSIRNTLLILGAVFAKNGRLRVPNPGGCKLGDRKHDIHLMILRQFGAVIDEDEQGLEATRETKLKACDIHLPMRSTGATENAILIAALAEGTTNIWNPHIRPEILDLIEMLNEMGARILIRGQERIVVSGVPVLRGTRHKAILDNMEALTWLVASMITRGHVEIKNFPFEHLEVPLIFLRESGARVYRCGTDALVHPGSCFPIDISTGPYPGINSDMQPILAAFAACSHGTSSIVDLRFLGRYAYVDQFRKMGVEARIDGPKLTICGQGKEHLTGAEVVATDLRAGISLALLGLACERGETVISDAWQIERGYSNFREKLTSLGGAIM